MATLEELRTAVDTLLTHPLGLGRYQLGRQVAEKAYEAYVFGLCLRAVREIGATPTLRGIRRAPDPFVFRGAPGQLHSQSQNFGFAEFEVNGEAFEIHCCVEFRGSSGMTHEFDVSIVRQTEAIRCRAYRVDPQPGGLIAGWECKFYAGTLDKSLGRALVGLLADMGSAIRLRGLCSNSANPQLSKYLKPRNRPYPHFHLTPRNRSNEDIFVNLLKAEIKKLTGA